MTRAAVQDVDLLAGIPPELITERLRTAVRKAAVARRNLEDGIRKASDGAAAAAAAGDVVAEASSRSLLRELQALHVPAADPDTTEEALELAANRIAALQLPEPPTPRYLSELAAYDSLPIDFRYTHKVSITGQMVLRPMAGPTDSAAWSAAKDLAAQHRRVADTVAAWRAGRSQVGGDCEHVVNHVRAAAGCIELAAKYVARHAEVVELVRKADDEHLRFGLNWTAPYGISTPAIEALARRS